jgi:ADP-heptose:LPS heptosyltransferase
VSLGARDFLRAVYWRGHRQPADVGHMLGVAAGFAGKALFLPARLRAAGRRQRVAIVLVERIGDIVAAEPIARLARRRFPGAWIAWIVQPAHAPIPRCYPEIDEVIPVRCLTEWMLLERLGLFDVVWNLHVNGFYCAQCSIHRNDPGVVPHLGDYFDHGSLLDVQCLSAGLPRLGEGPRLVPPAAAVAAVDALALPRRTIVIHAASVEPRRQWGVARWRALVARLLAADPAATIVEVGTQPFVLGQVGVPGQDVPGQDGARARSLCGRLSILETAEVIRRAVLFIGIDSGPAHLANAVATPGVLLLGRYHGFARYMPYSGGYADGTRATVLHAEGETATLTADQVFAAATARLAADASVSELG